MSDAPNQKKLVVCQACQARFLVAVFDPAKRYKCKACGAVIVGSEVDTPSQAAGKAHIAGRTGRAPIKRTILEAFSKLEAPDRQNVPPAYDDGFPDSMANMPIPLDIQWPATRIVSPDSDDDLSDEEDDGDGDEDHRAEMTDSGLGGIPIEAESLDHDDGDDHGGGRGGSDEVISLAQPRDSGRQPASRGGAKWDTPALHAAPAKFRISTPEGEIPRSAGNAVFPGFDSVQAGPITQYQNQLAASGQRPIEEANLDELMAQGPNVPFDPVMATHPDVSRIDLSDEADDEAADAVRRANEAVSVLIGGARAADANAHGTVMEQLGLGENDGVELHRADDVPEKQRSSSFAVHGSAKRYDLFGEIARGGMGAVVRARDVDLRREVALKVMLGDKTRDRQIRFIEEAQITGQLEHPNIIPIHDLGVDGSGRLFFSMKLVRGRSLADLLDDLAAAYEAGHPGMALVAEGAADASDAAAHLSSDRRTTRFRPNDPRISKNRKHHEPRTRLLPLHSLGQRLQMFLKICDAIAFAHSKGVIHRDVKPENIMVGEFGEVQVMDWGLAKVLGRHRDSVRDALVVTDRSENSVLTTLEGTVAGTPAYMPPEQARGEIDKLDARSDVYSLGAILFELLTLEPPFVDDDVQRVLRDVKAGRVTPPSGRNPDMNVPRELDAVVLTAMAFRPAQRYQTVLELKADIEAYLEGRTLKRVTYSSWQLTKKWVYNHRVTAAAVAAAVFMLVAGVAFTVILQRQWREEEIAAMIATGERAEREGRPDEAQRLFFQVLGLRDDPEIRAKAQRAAVSAEGQKRLEQAQTALKSAREVFSNQPVDRLPPAQRIPILFEAMRHLNIAFGLAPDDSTILHMRREINLKLGDAALETEDYSLAQHSYLEAGRAGLDSSRVNLLLDRVRSTRDSLVEQQRDEVRRLIEELRQPVDARTMQATRDRILTMPGPHTVRILLDSIHSRFPLERLVAVQCLGNLGASEASDELHRRVVSELMEALTNLDPLQDEEYAIALIWALADLQCGDALELIDRKRHAARPDSMVWLRTSEAFRQLPFPDALLDGRPNAPRDAKGYFDRGSLRLLRLEYDEAEKDFGRAIQMGYGAEAHARRGEARLKLAVAKPALTEAGLDDLRTAIQLEPNVPMRVVALGRALQQLKRTDEAIRTFSSVLRDSPTYASALVGRGECYLAKKSNREAERDFLDAMKADPMGARARVGLGRALVRGERLYDAEEVFSQAIRLDAGLVEAYIGRAVVYSHLSRLALARADVQIALRLNPRSADAYLARAALHLANGHYESTLIDCDFAEQIDPMHDAIWLNRIAVDFYRNDLQAARQRAETAMREYPDQSEAFAWGGIIAAFQMRRNDAYRHFDQAIGLAPDSWQLYLQYSMILSRDNEFARAQQLLTEAQSRMPREYLGMIQFMYFAMQFSQTARQIMHQMNQAAAWDAYTNHYVRAQVYLMWSLPGARRAAELAAEEFTKSHEVLEAAGMPQEMMGPIRIGMLRDRGSAYKRAGKPWLAIRDFEELLSGRTRMGGMMGGMMRGMDAQSNISLAEAYADLIYAHRANDPPVPDSAPSASEAADAAILHLQRAISAGAKPHDIREVRAFEVLKDDPRFMRLIE